MSRVRNKDTKPESTLRSALHRRGCRFRKNVSALPGRPDVVFTRVRLAVFVDGDFWHGYRYQTWRDSLPSFWREKIGETIARDKAIEVRLRDSGWCVLRLWEHEVEEDLESCVSRVVARLRRGRDGHG